MKKIIIPIDFSVYSEYALKAAALIAKKQEAELYVLHMLELSPALLTESDQDHQTKFVFYLKLAEQKLERFLQKDYLKGLKITSMVKHYKVFSELNDIGHDIGADLIVMGSRGATGIKELFIGSNTEKVVRHSEIPVLIVKNDPINIDFKTVVFASDFSEEAVPVFLEAKELFRSLDSKLHLVHINLPNESFRSSSEIQERVRDFLMKAEGHLDNLPTVNYVCDYSVEQGILNFANAFGADLIATATHGRTGFAHFFEGSVSENITNHSTLPVMTFKI